MTRLRIGTSGWNYKDWRGILYPEGVPQRQWLSYYSQQYNSAEINFSFYRLPSAQTYKKWHAETPGDFVFAVKCSRLITHAKRLRQPGDLWENFLNNASHLQNKLGPVLCQLPENFACDAHRLAEFLQETANGRGKSAPRIALEFRHESWFNRQIYQLLEKHNVALVVADSAQFPRHEIITADFAYFRYHGPHALFHSSYSRARLKKEAELIDSCLEQKLDTFVYFNNDGNGYAVKNSRELSRILEVRGGRKAG